MPLNKTIINDQLDEAVQSKIDAERIAYLYSFFGVRLLGLGVLIFAIAFISMDVVDNTYVLLWMVLGLVILVARTVLHVLFLKRQSGKKGLASWGQFFIAGFLVTGSYLGMASYVLYLTDSIPHNISLTAIMVAYVAGAMNSFASHPKEFSLFVLLSLLPFAIGFTYIGSQFAILICFCLLVAIFLFIKMTGKIHQSYMENIYLRYQFENQKKIAEKANIEKSKFLAAASHDLRQPLFALQLYSSILNSRLNDQDNRELLSKMSMSIESLIGLFNALLDLSKLDAQTIKPKKSNIKLTEIFQRMDVEYKTSVAEKGLKWRVCDCPYSASTDPVLLETIIRNLISNAIRYTNHGEIALRCEETDQGIKVSISDTGIGIPRAKHEAVFKEYYQLGNPERDRTKGLGLGLSIVDRLTKLLDIKLKLESDIDSGTTISLWLAKSDSTVQSDVLDHDTAMCDKLDPEQNERTHLLVIDDEEIIRSGLHQTLTDWGYKVTTAASGEDALIALQEHGSPDLILSDYRLRKNKTGMDAIKLLEESVGKRLPAIILTGDTSAEVLIELQSTGYPVLHKPFKPAKLRTILIKLLA